MFKNREIVLSHSKRKYLEQPSRRAHELSREEILVLSAFYQEKDMTIYVHDHLKNIQPEPMVGASLTQKAISDILAIQATFHKRSIHPLGLSRRRPGWAL